MIRGEDYFRLRRKECTQKGLEGFGEDWNENESEIQRVVVTRVRKGSSRNRRQPDPGHT